MTTEAPADAPQFNLFDNALAQMDPFEFFKGMRAAAPVVKLPGPGFWAVTRYEDTVRILRDPDTFSSAVDAMSMRGEKRPPTILFDDPPIHTRMRGLISKAFTPRVVELQRPAIEEYCAELIDKMCAKTEADLVAELAYPLPVMVIAGMLGVQDGDMATFKRWSDAIIENLPVTLLQGEEAPAMTAINAEFDEYFRARLDKLRAQPEDNLLSGLVHAVGEDGSRLSEEDLLVVCRVLLVAGNETTTGLIINSIRAFSAFPEAMTRVKQDMSLIPSAIEESLRYYPPFFATFRRTMREVDIGGVTVPANERVLVLLASANRDAAAFPDPDTFVVDRQGNRHVGFGMGIHYCVGAPLARLEGEIALRTLLPRITRVTVGASEPGSLLRPGGPEKLKVTFELDPAYAAVTS